MISAMNKISKRVLAALIASAVLMGISTFICVKSTEHNAEVSVEYLSDYATEQAKLSEAAVSISAIQSDILSALASDDNVYRQEMLTAASEKLTALEESCLEEGSPLADAEPVLKLIRAETIREALFTSIKEENMKIADNIFFSEYRPRLTEAAECTAELMTELNNSRAGMNIQIYSDARTTKIISVCLGLMAVCLTIFSLLYLDRKLNAQTAEPEEAEEDFSDKYELLSEDEEDSERLMEAEDTIETAVRCINILADGDPDAAPDGEYPYRYEHVLSAVRKMKAKLRFIAAQINRASEFVNAESVRISDNAEELSAAALEHERAAAELTECSQGMAELMTRSKDISEKLKALCESNGSSVKDCEERLDDAKQVCEKLSESRSDMEELIKNASDIASRANLLAVNTAMNASKGESSGKSLAASADEARALAVAASDLSAQTAQAAERFDENIRISTEAVSAASEALKGFSDASENALDMEKALSEQCDKLSCGEDYISKISGFVILNKNAYEEYAVSGRMLSEQSLALKKIVPSPVKDEEKKEEKESEEISAAAAD